MFTRNYFTIKALEVNDAYLNRIDKIQLCYNINCYITFRVQNRQNLFSTLKKNELF